MKTDRLLSIVMTLLSRRAVTAGELASRFEVNIRTIYRDLESLMDAGIPIETVQGRNGGIRIPEGFRFDKTLMTPGELETLKVAQGGLSTVLKTPESSSSMEKLRVATGNQAPETLALDLAPWGESIEPAIHVELLRQAARDHRWVTFEYQSVGSEKEARWVEPYLVVYKGWHWYLYGFCCKRQDFRLFKLGRMQGVQVTSRSFEPREIDPESKPWDKGWSVPIPAVDLILRIHRSKCLQYGDWCSPDIGVEDADGYLVCTQTWPLDEGLYRFLMGTGGDIEVLYPPEVRKELEHRSKKILAIYKT